MLLPIDEAEARWIRVLRVDLGCSWGRIGELFEKAVGRRYGGYQESGAGLCVWAARILGEDVSQDPWN